MSWLPKKIHTFSSYSESAVNKIKTFLLMIFAEMSDKNKMLLLQ